MRQHNFRLNLRLLFVQSRTLQPWYREPSQMQILQQKMEHPNRFSNCKAQSFDILQLDLFNIFLYRVHKIKRLYGDHITALIALYITLMELGWLYV